MTLFSVRNDCILVGLVSCGYACSLKDGISKLDKMGGCDTVKEAGEEAKFPCFCIFH